MDAQAMTERIGSSVAQQLQTVWSWIQDDMQNPAQKIPERIRQQSQDFLQEAANVFADTPAGLQEPPFTVVMETPHYQVRDYPAYTVVCTDMKGASSGSTRMSVYDSNVDDTNGAWMDDMATSGAAFTTLASYIFGGNQDQQVFAMTTPVTTTWSGEMRFYVPNALKDMPSPLNTDSSSSSSSTGPFATKSGQSVYLQEIPAARLAVRRFAGFATSGEIARQKEILLQQLALDEGSGKILLDVPHGQTVKHVVFQYNPPYTLPVVRRNEIAVPVLLVEEKEEAVNGAPVQSDSLSREW
jgi:SOUL heme-binding protein